MVQNYSLFQNHCRGCNKSIPTEMIREKIKNKDGSWSFLGGLKLPKVYCNSVCSTKYQNQARMDTTKDMVEFKPTLRQENLTERMSKIHWNNKIYETEVVA